MKIVDSYRRQISTINRNIELDDLVETALIENDNLAEDNTSTNLMEINNLIEISESNILTNLIEINNLIETSEPNISTNLMEIDNLIESTTITNLTETNNLLNLIELIETQKNELIKNNLIEINQQFTDIKIRSNLYPAGDLKIKTLTEQNNKNNFRIRRPNTTTLSFVNHMATCVAKPIIDTYAVLAIANNNCPIFNSDNFSNVLIVNIYILELRKQNLKSLEDYLDALTIITSIELLQQYLQNYTLLLILIVNHWVNCSSSVPKNNNYFVENFHSQLRANINNSYTADNIIEQPYQNQLDYLIKKSSLFLLEHFQKIFQNIGKSKIIPIIPNKDREKNKFFMATLDEILELKCLLTGYHTAHLPSFNTCDICNISIKFSTEYYKKGIYKQIRLFKKGLEKIEDDKDILDDDDINDDDDDNDNNLGEVNNNKINENIENELQIAINFIDQWI
ncbi:hypothetical protein F8M41_016138 [Gigaspora margarita]|uniref:Uncharacterized protein n=1 Tax=Gigaspora margarita TaxID=4874 RepID=A0A8H4APP3_GIGMA|nr:hypothetical protein F8M41_016138 [Gigaspora margarita]